MQARRTTDGEKTCWPDQAQLSSQYGEDVPERQWTEVMGFPGGSSRDEWTLHLSCSTSESVHKAILDAAAATI